MTLTFSYHNNVTSAGRLQPIHSELSQWNRDSFSQGKTEALLGSLKAWKPGQHAHVVRATLVFFNTLSLAGNSGRLTWVKHSSRKSRVTYCYSNCVCSIFVCPHNGLAASVWDKSFTLQATWQNLCSAWSSTSSSWSSSSLSSSLSELNLVRRTSARALRHRLLSQNISVIPHCPSLPSDCTVCVCVCVCVCMCIFCIIMNTCRYIYIFCNIFHLDVHYVCMLVQRFELQGRRFTNFHY